LQLKKALREHEQQVEDLQNELRAAAMTAEMATARTDEQLETVAFLEGTVDELRADLTRAHEETRELRSEVATLLNRPPQQPHGLGPRSPVSSTATSVLSDGASKSNSRASNLPLQDTPSSPAAKKACVAASPAGMQQHSGKRHAQQLLADMFARVTVRACVRGV
jgi:seryl-tRNA synthetase